MDYDGLILSFIHLFTQFRHNTEEIYFQRNVHLYDIALQC